MTADIRKGIKIKKFNWIFILVNLFLISAAICVICG